MDIPVRARVVGMDALAGRSACVILNCAIRLLSHMVTGEVNLPSSGVPGTVGPGAGKRTQKIHLHVNIQGSARLEGLTAVGFVQTEVFKEG